VETDGAGLDGHQVDYTEALRLIALNETTLVGASWSTSSSELITAVEPRTMAFAQVAALIATGGTVHSYGALVDGALELGVRPEQLVGVLMAIEPIVGSAAIVAAAPDLALALGYDVQRALEDPS
jgi:alkylhydroperoxidase/carboxymuconolactone decarboxylase family protein YurZ